MLFRYWCCCCCCCCSVVCFSFSFIPNSLLSCTHSSNSPKQKQLTSKFPKPEHPKYVVCRFRVSGFLVELRFISKMIIYLRSAYAYVCSHSPYRVNMVVAMYVWPWKEMTKRRDHFCFVATPNVLVIHPSNNVCMHEKLLSLT